LPYFRFKGLRVVICCLLILGAVSRLDAKDITIKIPPSIKEVWVERATINTKDIEKEISIYREQQAVFWPVACFILAIANIL